MKQHIIYKYTSIILLILLFVCPFTAKSQEPSALSVICNPKGCPSELNMLQLKSILKGEKQRWSDGTKVVLVLMKNATTIGSLTCSKIYKMSNNDVNKHFLALQFQGKGEIPKFLNSSTEVQNEINQTPGAIGVIAFNSSVTEKIVLVDGKKSF